MAPGPRRSLRVSVSFSSWSCSFCSPQPGSIGEARLSLAILSEFHGFSVSLVHSCLYITFCYRTSASRIILLVMAEKILPPGAAWRCNVRRVRPAVAVTKDWRFDRPLARGILLLVVCSLEWLARTRLQPRGSVLLWFVPTQV